MMSAKARSFSGYQALCDEDCGKVVDATFSTLERTGCLIKSDTIRNLLCEAGCTSEGERVSIPVRLMKEAIKSAQKSDELVIFDREGSPAFTFGENESHFGPAITTVFLVDPETGEKRHGTRADAANTATLIDALPNIEWASTLAGIFDGNQELADLYEVQALLKHTKKPIMYWAASPENLEYQFEMFETVAGGSQELQEKPFTIALVCPIDPLVHTDEGLEQLAYLAGKKSPVVYIAGSSLGSSSPITIAGSLVIGLADTLVGLLVSQLVNPGTPFIASKFSDNVNMRTGASYHSGPEFVTANMATADIFRYLQLPFCLNFGDSDSGLLDQAAAFDIAAQIQSAVLSCSTMNFASGALENGNVSNYSALVYSNEIIGYFRKLYASFDIDDDTLLLDSIDTVGPGGNFLAEDATLENFTGFWSSEVFVPRSYDESKNEGFDDMSDILNAYAKKIIDQGSKSALDPKLSREVEAIVARAEAQR